MILEQEYNESFIKFMAKLLNTLLEERNWKGSELVRRLGVAKSAGYPLLKSSDKLHPKAKMPRIYTVERLMSAFEMDADDAFKAHRKRLLVTAIEK